MKSINSKTTSFNYQPELSSISNYENYQYQSSNIRVICKKILYLIGIPYEIANEETLIKKEYLGQYGSIHKIIVNKNGYLKNESNSPTYSSYITYSNEIEASLALLSLNNSTLFNHKLNACYGTNKYCNSFLKGLECNNKDCFYLHEEANKNDIIIKNDTQMKLQFIEQQKIATKIADIFSLEQKKLYIQTGLDNKKEFQEKNIENYFPTIDTIYNKKYILDFQNEEKEENSYFNFNKKYSSPNNNYNKKNKINNNGYSSPELIKYNNNDQLIEDGEENEEYILVKQPSRQKKKYGGNKNNYKRNHYKKNNFKLKFTLEKYKIKYNIKEEIIPSSPNDNNNQNTNLLNELVDNSPNDKSKIISSDNSITNSQTISGYNTNESSSQNNLQEEADIKVNLFKNSKKSRFSFANSDLENMEQKDLFIVPDFIKEIVNKKFYALCFASHIKKNGDTSNGSDFLEKILFEKEIKIVNNWAISN
jgi:hypothetical protein